MDAVTKSLFSHLWWEKERLHINSSEDVIISLPWRHCPGWQHLEPAERRPVAGTQQRPEPEHQPPQTWPQDFPSASGTLFSPGSYRQEEPGRWVQRSRQGCSTAAPANSLCSGEVGLRHVALGHGSHLSNGGVDHLHKRRNSANSVTQRFEQIAGLWPSGFFITSLAEPACAMV